MELTQEQVAILGGLADAVKGMGTGTKAVATTHTGVLLHGPGGILSSFGTSRDVFPAHIGPQGIGNILPLKPSNETDPRFASITGVTGSTGDQPENTCDDAPTAYIKGCYLSARFGRIRYDTHTIEFDEVITKYNRGDFTDLMFVGNMLGNDDMAKGIVPPGLTGSDFLNYAVLTEMLIVGVQFQREVVRQMWQGNMLLGGQFPGLDYQINTGQMDADTGVLCPALDSDVKNFGYSDVCGSERDIVEYISALCYYLKEVAIGTQLEPVTWVLAMKRQLWQELSACWPCRYFTNRCQDFGGTTVAVINDESNVKLRDDMRKNMYLPVNGENIKVVIDDGILEHNADNNQNLQPGEYASTIYMVPLTALGRYPVTYREYLDYKSTVAKAVDAPFRGKTSAFFWTDNGIYSWAPDNIKWCFTLSAKTEQRVILLTPHLAGRIDAVKYTPTQHLRSPWPDSDYFKDGGVSTRPASRDTYMLAAGGAIR